MATDNKKLKKSLAEMSYLEMVVERERVLYLVQHSKNILTVKQNSKYLKKINAEINEYEKNRYGKVITHK